MARRNPPARLFVALPNLYGVLKIKSTLRKDPLGLGGLRLGIRFADLFDGLGAVFLTEIPLREGFELFEALARLVGQTCRFSVLQEVADRFSKALDIAETLFGIDIGGAVTDRGQFVGNGLVVVDRLGAVGLDERRHHGGADVTRSAGDEFV